MIIIKHYYEYLFIFYYVISFRGMLSFITKHEFSVAQDDMHVRVYNYNTLERVHQFEAHSDYLRSIAVHPTQTFILTSSGRWLHHISSSLLHLYVDRW